jgi:hypothetical protein
MANWRPYFLRSLAKDRLLESSRIGIDAEEARECPRGRSFLFKQFDRCWGGIPHFDGECGELYAGAEREAETPLAWDLDLHQGFERGRETGATRQDRTGDLLITNQPLYQLS